MIGKEIDIPTPDGTMDGYAAHPDGGGPFALVVLFMDVWGLREELFAIARRVASHGYYCIVPNLFYREGKIRYERRNAEGKMVSFDTLPVALQEEMRSHSAKVDRPRRVLCCAGIPRAVSRQCQPARHLAGHRRGGFTAYPRASHARRVLLRLW